MSHMLRNSIKKLGGKRSNAQTHRIRKKSRKTKRFGGSPTPKNTTIRKKFKSFLYNFKNKFQKLPKLYNDENKTELTNFEKNTIALENLYNSKLYEGYEDKKPPPKNRYGNHLKSPEEPPIPSRLEHVLGPYHPGSI
jgi:hypothetical protein